MKDVPSTPRIGVWSWSVTALGGFLFGIVGLILAVPFTVITGNGMARLRARGFFQLVADRAQPTIQKALD